MEIAFDPAKDESNRRKHGLPLIFGRQVLSDPHRLDRPDERQVYGEKRVQALGMVKGRLYLTVYTRRDEIYRIISVRKANSREQRRYAESHRDP